MTQTLKNLNVNEHILGENQTSPSQLGFIKPVPRAGFSFLTTFGDKTQPLRNVHYKPAKIHKGDKWFVFYSYRDPQTNKFKRFRVYEDINRLKGDEREHFANLLRDAVNYGLKNGFNPFKIKGDLVVEVKNWTLSQGLNHFKTHLPERGLRTRTIQSYESVLRMLNEFLAPLLHESIKEIDKNHITTALRNAKKKNSWSGTTYNNNIAFTRAIFNFLKDENIIEVNPAERIKSLPENITRNKYFDTEIFEKIREKAPEDLLRFIMFLYHTGTRPNEARQLKYEHILRERNLLLIPGGISKNKKDGYVPLTDYVKTNFVQKEGFIFGTKVNHFTKKFLKLKKDLKLPDEYNLYSIKATRAIHLAQDKADPYYIMQLFRHSGLDITMKYLRGLGLNLNVESVEKGIKF